MYICIYIHDFPLAVMVSFPSSGADFVPTGRLPRSARERKKGTELTLGVSCSRQNAWAWVLEILIVYSQMVWTHIHIDTMIESRTSRTKIRSRFFWMMARRERVLATDVRNQSPTKANCICAHLIESTNYTNGTTTGNSDVELLNLQLFGWKYIYIYIYTLYTIIVQICNS